MQIVNLVGLVLNVIGTFVASFSAGSLFTRIHTALMAHQTTIESYLDPAERNVPVFHGLDEGRGEEVKKSNIKLGVGMGVIVLGFLLQLTAAVADLLHKR